MCCRCQARSEDKPGLTLYIRLTSAGIIGGQMVRDLLPGMRNTLLMAMGLISSSKMRMDLECIKYIVRTSLGNCKALGGGL